MRLILRLVIYATLLYVVGYMIPVFFHWLAGSIGL